MLNTQKNNIYLGLTFGFIAAVIWASFPAITKLGIEQTLTLYDIAALRFTVAGIILLPIFWRKRFIGVSYPGVILIACGAGAPYLIIATGGLSLTPASHFGVITPSCMLIFATLGSYLWLGNKPHRNQLIGISLIIAGLLFIGWEGLLNSHHNAWVGDLMLVVAGCFWAIYTVAIRYWSVEPLHAITIVSVVSMIGYVPAYLFAGNSMILFAPASEIILQALFQGLLSAILALLFYTRAVAILGAARGAIFGALVPSLALILAFPILGEIPTLLQWLGVFIVTLGMMGFLRSGN